MLYQADRGSPRLKLGLCRLNCQIMRHRRSTVSLRAKALRQHRCAKLSARSEWRVSGYRRGRHMLGVNDGMSIAPLNSIKKFK